MNINVLKTINKIEPVTIGRGDSGRYEYKDVSGVTESGDKAFRITVETGFMVNEDFYFKHRENAQKFLNEK